MPVFDALTKSKRLDWTYDKGIDWCEPNWFISSHVAEFFNALTNIFQTILFCGWLFNIIYLHYKHGIIMETRWILSMFIFMIASICGAFAHATITCISGVIDEFVIFISTIVFIYIVITVFRIQPVNCIVHIGLVLLIVSYGVILLIYPFYGAILTVTSQVIINLTAFVFIFSTRFNRRMFEKLQLVRTRTIGSVILFSSIICAILDIGLCQHLNYSILHSIWHIGLGMALQLLMSVLFQFRLSIIDTNYKLNLKSVTGMIKDFPLYLTVKYQYTYSSSTQVEV